MEKKNCSAPYSVDDAKKERSRVLAHKRRATNRSVMDELTKVREGCGFGAWSSKGKAVGAWLMIGKECCLKSEK